MTYKEMYKNSVEEICRQGMVKQLNMERFCRKKRILPKKLIAVVLAAAAVMLCGIAASAYKAGWLTMIFGSKADMLYSDGTDYAVPLENVVITCDSSDYIFTLGASDEIGEYLFFEIIAERTDGAALIPDKTGTAFRRYRNNSGVNLDMGISEVGTTENGGIVMAGYIMKTGGFFGGEHISLTYEELAVSPSEQWRGITVPMTVTVEFDISDTPQKNINTVKVGERVDISGESYMIDSISVSPMSVSVCVENSSEETVCDMLFADSYVVLKDGTRINCAGTNSTDGCNAILILESFVNVEAVETVYIGGLEINI